MRDKSSNSQVDETKANRNSIFLLTRKPLGFNVACMSSPTDLSQAAAVLGSKGGKAKTKAKVKAARANGRKGGRPRKRKAA